MAIVPKSMQCGPIYVGAGGNGVGEICQIVSLSQKRANT